MCSVFNLAIMDRRIFILYTFVTLFCGYVRVGNGQEDPYDYRPENTAVLIGSDVTTTFDCKLKEGEMQWSETTKKDNRELTFKEELFPAVQDEGYALEKSNGGFNLTVPVDILTRAGQFSCGQSYAYLVTLGSNPQCSVNMTRVSMENDIIQYTCQMQYRGDIPPKMEWSHNGNSVQNSQLLDESVSGQEVKVSIIVDATLDRVGDIYQCNTFFEHPDVDAKDFAKNAPDYRHTYVADALIIKPLSRDDDTDKTEPGDEEEAEELDWKDIWFTTNNFIVFGVGAGVGLIIGILITACCSFCCFQRKKSQYKRVSRYY